MEAGYALIDFVNIEERIMKKLLSVVLLAILASMGFTSTASAGDKVYACHITGMNDAGTRLTGHVISISDKALKAHCKHDGVPDHRPNGVIGNAEDACDLLDLEGKDYDKCLDRFAINADCSRAIGNDNAVARLCD
jgi:hypothetical protein